MKKNFILTFWFYALVAGICLPISCTNEKEAVMPSNSQVHSALRVGIDTEKINKHLERMALAVAKATQNESFRELLKSEALLQVDGDYDIFYQTFSKKKTKDGKGIHDSLKKLGILDEVLNEIPILQISIPVNCENWNTTDYSPLVTFVSPDTDKKDQVKAYDKDGNIHWLPTNVEPSAPVIVVSLSERFDESGKSKYDFTHKREKGARLANSPEHMYAFTFDNNLGNYESWIAGKPEVSLVIAGVRNGAVVNPIYKGYWNPKRDDCSGSNWYIPDNFTFTWTEDYGMYTTYYWLEEDGGATESTPISLTWQPNGAGSLTAFSTTIPKHNSDKEMGTVTIWKNEANYKVYGSGFRFSLRYEN